MSIIYCVLAGVIWIVVIGAIGIVASAADRAIENAKPTNPDEIDRDYQP